MRTDSPVNSACSHFSIISARCTLFAEQFHSRRGAALEVRSSERTTNDTTYRILITPRTASPAEGAVIHHARHRPAFLSNTFPPAGGVCRARRRYIFKFIGQLYLNILTVAERLAAQESPLRRQEGTGDAGLPAWTSFSWREAAERPRTKCSRSLQVSPRWGVEGKGGGV